jgi:hypothetical protein
VNAAKKVFLVLLVFFYLRVFVFLVSLIFFPMFEGVYTALFAIKNYCRAFEVPTMCFLGIRFFLRNPVTQRTIPEDLTPQEVLAVKPNINGLV